MTETGSRFLDDLAARDLVADSTDRAALVARLEEGPATVYVGFDPTADSLHIGHLMGLLALRRFQDAGHRPIALAGGATGMIGDPSGRSEERNLLDDAALNANLEGIVPQLRRFLDFSPGPNQAILADNRDWTTSMTAIEFLRDVGKHVTVNQMMGKESVRARMEGTHGISYTEFSYMLLQANDFVALNERHGCEIQLGGTDQWGNISLGVDLARRRLGAHLHGLTWPLLTRRDGTKYGKTASGEQIWLSPARMSPYRFYQAWIGADDDEIRSLLLRLTLLPVAEAEAVASEHAAAPEKRLGQRRLATELTSLVHGAEAIPAVLEASEVLFGGDPATVAAPTFETIAAEVPTSHVGREALGDGLDPAALFAEVGLAKSRGDARRTLDQRGLSVNGQRLEPGDTLGHDRLLHDRYLLLRRGRTQYHLVVAGDAAG
ncbi:MAG: tyrosine--tRNA ligase [Actinomycetota bacterium]|nr:tyrosine--tRNA ligase [Actinomycetota bacterium]